jgi:hypothetical protein
MKQWLKGTTWTPPSSAHMTSKRAALRKAVAGRHLKRQLLAKSLTGC